MSRIDYSKWDNLDTDSDSEVEEKPKRATAAAKAQSQPRPAPVPAPTAPGVQCTYAPCSGDPKYRFFATTTVPEDHRVFAEGTLSPVAVLIGLPLRLWRIDQRPSLAIPRSATMDNQAITYIMIDPFSGFAPPQWQQGIGSVICARQDKKPLPAEHVEAFWMFVNELLGLFSIGEQVDPTVEMSPSRFREFYGNYRLEMLEAPARRDKWEAIAAPWEV